MATRHLDQFIVGSIMAMCISIMAMLTIMPMENLGYLKTKIVTISMFVILSLPLIYSLHGTKAIAATEDDNYSYYTSTVMMNIDKGIYMTVSPSWVEARFQNPSINKIGK